MSEPGTGERSRFDSLGLIAAELLHDLAAEMDHLRDRTELLHQSARRRLVTETEAVTLRDEMERVGRLVSDLVAWIARPVPRATYRPTAALDAMAARLRSREARVTLELRCGIPAETTLRGPESFFTRAVGNLVRNGLRHAASRVEVSLEGRPHGGVPGVVVRVEDDGPGIDEAVLPELFAPLRTQPPRGHGLGLASTAWLVEQLGGPPPRAGTAGMGGACFELWLPRASQLTSAVRTMNAPDPTTARLRVALLDDDPSVRRILVRIIERAGHSAVELDPVPATVEMLLSGSVPGDVLLLDRNLGFADGFHVWSRLAEAGHPLSSRAALLTGGLPPADAPEELVVLHKPLSHEALRDWLEAVVAARDWG